MGAPVVFFEIIGKDAHALRTFYHDAFGWEVGETIGGSIPDYTLMKPNPHAGIEGGIGTRPPGYDGHLTFYLAVPDVAQALATAVQHGGMAMLGPLDAPGGVTLALFRDPEGHIVGLIHNPAASG
jgi:predicted enzyme related to lactoylglutathione lyase